MSEMLPADPSSRIDTSDDRFGDVLPAADVETSESEPPDSYDLSDNEVRHRDALSTIDRIAAMPKVSVELGKRARGLESVLDKMAHISMLKGFLKGGGPDSPEAVQDKINTLVRQINSELFIATGLDKLVASGDLTPLDANDTLTQLRHGLRTEYIGPDNTKKREAFMKHLKTQ